MSVFPGEGGQGFILETTNKIKQLKEYLVQNNLDLDIEVDGGINDETAKLAIESGADIIVAGSYIINAENKKEAIEKIKNIC